MTDQPADRSEPAPAQGRYRLSRAGILNVWQYDHQEFEFGGGRLLLRGKNGAGKSKALEMLLPYLLDGDARRIDAAATGRTTLKWLMLDGWSGTNKLGYLWVEFLMDGGTRVTLGAGIKASAASGQAKATFFVTGKVVGTDLALVRDGRPLPLDTLRSEVGSDNCFDSVAEYRARVAKELFGLTDAGRYRNLTHLLYRLRQPTIGDRIEDGRLEAVLADALPPVDDDVIDKVARNLDDLDDVRDQLGRLEQTDTALAAFLTSYRGYLHGVLRRRAGVVREHLSALSAARRRAGDAERELTRRAEEEREAETAHAELLRGREEAEADLRALHDSAAYRGLSELRERRATVRALSAGASAAWATAALARDGEAAAASRLADETERAAAQLGELRGLLRETRATARRAGIEDAHFGTVPDPLPAQHGTAGRRASGATAPPPADDPTDGPAHGSADGADGPVGRVASASAGGPVDRGVRRAGAGMRGRRLVDVEGEVHEFAEHPVRALDGAAVRGGLGEWRRALGDAGRIVRQRDRLAAELAELLGKAARAEADARELTADAERLGGQLEEAQDRRLAREEEASTAASAYRDAVLTWALRLDAMTSGLGGEVRELVADEPPRDVAGHVRRAARAAVDPLLARLDQDRDAVRDQERRLVDQLAGLRAERAHIEAVADPEPPRSRYSTAARDTGGLPFFLAVDFQPGVSDDHRAGIEAALEASGLLSGWLTAEGVTPDPDTPDLLVGAVPAAERVDGPTLAGVLRPLTPAAARVLEAVGLGESDDAEEQLAVTGLGDRTVNHAAPDVSVWPAGGPARRPASWMGIDGRWRLGVASGRHAKPAAEYIGAAVRAETRRRRLAELAERIATVEAEVEGLRARRTSVERQRADAAEALAAQPDARGLEAAWIRLDEALQQAVRLAAQAEKARREAERARSGAGALRMRAEADASANELPADEGPLRALRGLLDRLSGAVGLLDRDAARTLAQLDRHDAELAAFSAAVETRDRSEDAYTVAHGELTTAARELDQLERTVGAGERELLAREADARGRLERAVRELPELDRRTRRSRDDRVAAVVLRDTRITELRDQEQAVIAGGSQLRDPLGASGLALAAGLEEGGPEGGPEGGMEFVEEYDRAQEGEVRSRVQALRALADAVEGRLGRAADDVGDTLILRRAEELRDGLAGGYDAEAAEHDGIKRFTLNDDTGAHDVAIVGRRIRVAAAEARDKLAVREQEAFERFLLGELGDHLSRQVLAAEQLIAAMNDTLREVRTSHGLGARLVWRLAESADADVRVASELLRRASALRTRGESERLRDALRRRIEDFRRADPTAGYAVHLKGALDYRSWFEFSVFVTDAAHPDRERKLGRRTAMSQGEQRVMAYLVLFAAAAAHFSSLGRHAPHTPRLILLDDAFAKVDEPTHGRLLGLLVDLDLDFVLTSERLWGCFATVPALHVYEVLRDPSARGVAALHYHWDGRRKHLMGE
ncbi:TIGR02680 family protein [Spongiactinospora sp. TRM90649]|uniref:TIGR02680 family protein n=1 Tax=Spongiactinospora sp. TRM90649 TaxID=3031114 RepID=UPI0023F9038D|nr:TIGR02680 family protein [Spongiactinospora sp. TRM90649]MDF5752432.1 TIGR02680 family protein [Spongiactinospora sp. TRM90649]